MLNASRKPFIAGLALGLIHALLYGLAFHPTAWWLCGIVSLAPLCLASLGTSKPWRTALAVSLASMPMWAYHHQFIWKMSAAGIFPLVVYLAIYPGLFVWVLARTSRAMPRMSLALLVPIVWTGVEMLRGEVVWNGYAWYLLGHPMINMTPMVFWGSVIGVYGVGAIAAAIVGWCFELRRWAGESAGAAPVIGAAHKVRGNLIGITAVTLALVLLFGAGSMPPMSLVKGERIRVGAIQTNVPQDNRSSWSAEQRVADFREFAEMTRLAAEQHPPPQLIVWPETMFPGNALNEEAVRVERESGAGWAGIGPTTIFYDALIELQKEIGIPLIIGAKAIEGLRITADPAGRLEFKQDAEHNSVFLVQDGAVAGEHYDKLFLTPFGEVMPGISRWEWLERELLALGANGMSFSLKPGEGPKRLLARIDREAPEAGPIRLAAPICYEVIMQHICRQLVFNSDGTRAADLMVSPSNDGWFDWFDPGRAHMLLMARWRCVELGTPMIRAANTGMSAAVDAWGRLVALGPTMGADGGPPTGIARRPGVLISELQLARPNATPFAAYGNVVGWTSFWSMLIFVGMSFVPRKQKLPSEAAAGTPNPPTAPESAAPKLRLAGDDRES